MFKDKIYLASQSPRRQELVRHLFENVEVLSLKGEEPRWKRNQGPTEYLKLCLAFKSSLAQEYFSKTRTNKTAKSGGFLVADTIVVLNNEVLGKPLDLLDASKMLKKLSGNTHYVYTGFQLCYGAQIKAQVEFSEVTFHKLSSKEIEHYVKTHRPIDKAGAYGFQDGALKFVKKIKGSYLNIVGLPILALEAAAKNLGWK